MPKIARIETTPYPVALKSALSWGKGHQLASLEHVLVRVILEDGATGIAEATPRPTIYGETPASISAILHSEVSPRVLHADLHTFADVNALDQGLQIIKNNHCAKGAFNMALHSALAQSHGQSLLDWLGVEQTRTRLSYIVSTGTPADVLEDVAELFALGVRVFKVKVGKAPTQERETLQALFEAFPSVVFYVDANECLDPSTAPALLNALHEMGVAYCEEALPVRDLHARHALRHATSLPIIADDSAFTLPDLEREVQFDTFDILNIKTARNGFSQAHTMAERTLQAGKTIMVGSQASSLLGCLHAAAFALRGGITHPTECSFYLKTEADLSDAPPIVEGGYWERDALQQAFMRVGHP
ncbi:MAG: enolase C-terminal domain-like protein [Phototrophicaceae bacterium]